MKKDTDAPPEESTGQQDHSGLPIAGTDITRITDAEAKITGLTRDLRDRAESIETLLDLIPVGIFVVENGGPVRINRFGASLLGEDDDMKGFRELVTTLKFYNENGEIQPAEQALQRAVRTGEPVTSFEAELVYGDDNRRDVIMAATPLFNEQGTTRGALAAMLDISERKRAEAHQRLLSHELQHRVKNVLATVAALGRLMPKHGTAEEFSVNFIGRVTAMGRTHQLLSQENWRGTDLEALLRRTLESYLAAPEPRVVIRGPKILLKPNDASSIGLILHELATNATKYGALSVTNGRVEALWNVETSANGDQLVFTWSEKGGPRVKKPVKRGFGTDFVSNSADYELHGSAKLMFEPEGFRCVIAFPLRQNAEEFAAIQNGSGGSS